MLIGRLDDGETGGLDRVVVSPPELGSQPGIFFET